MESHSPRIALITGASSGLGWEFAKQIDQKNQVDEIWIVARREDLLNQLASQFKNSRARVFALDLTEAKGMSQLISALEIARPNLAQLINNAGFGLFGDFASLSIDRQLNMLDLNIRTLTELTYRALPYMGRGGQILQVASSAAFLPMPGFSVYAASKAYVRSFSLGLSEELRARDITVTAVCPGPINTEFFAVASGSADPIQASATESKSSFISATAPQVVEHALSAAAGGKQEAIYGFGLRVGLAASRHIPRRLTQIISNKFLSKTNSSEKKQ